MQFKESRSSRIMRQVAGGVLGSGAEVEGIFASDVNKIPEDIGLRACLCA